jgi:hypothetical protein
MTRFLIAAIVWLACGQPTPAQAPSGTVLPAPTPMLVTPSPALLPSGGSHGFVVSGGAVIGANGSYPYDSGMYLLGGSTTARATGYYRMVYPGTPGGPPLSPTTSYGLGRTGCSCGW